MKAAPPSSHPGPAAPSSAGCQGAPAGGAPLLNIANALTVLRIGLVPVFIWLMLQPGDSMRLAAAIVFMVAAATDRLDGQLARSRNLITSFGKIADPIADKALTLSAFILLSVAGRLWWWVTILIIVRELGITVMRFAMLRRAVMAASRGGKIKTVLQILALVGLLLPWHAVLPAVAAAALLRLSYALVAAALVVTVATGIDYVLQAIRISRENSAAGAADGARHG
ncbi:CDP-diacylglycerol--glycerol-3-phosphate3-phosphatidyltransferase [Actinomyces sp. Chiba101]|uniref:CDP-diacylglycerol--glycerol-3-phosphate 3-phosphatidyltransferase n=1 Tax=Actinomyces denticolens TaxID=52767 RepID=A0ABY1I7G4_9ACTO|nr:MULTISPECIES: CDP-diacylglycerol--glycerol-3-phosphate 3-phosphatidyltransferase [Actinomyces]BAW93453.1 CDP-diacylglycerol--glycerol-3-phosphate3-phosphatidyltransferase [Actinomyces sp. Chiba101]GAV93708.1 CDP-diacylglycerol--glycerol-3-phosphate3-phosphatidyltransferase [Actinomyces denticolens]SHI72888.1 CDP-diacylglycerol--glycerol-3-phosphate 3-phosphatidyltransferase [Actinomyces denticolens]SUU02969.1 Putative CDP-diacylglycerol--glycerol-3-phosphate 3-phosphatidyl-transferase 2 [Act